MPPKTPTLEYIEQSLCDDINLIDKDTPLVREEQTLEFHHSLTAKRMTGKTQDIQAGVVYLFPANGKRQDQVNFAGHPTGGYSSHSTIFIAQIGLFDQTDESIGTQMYQIKDDIKKAILSNPLRNVKTSSGEIESVADATHVIDTDYATDLYPPQLFLMIQVDHLEDEYTPANI